MSNTNPILTAVVDVHRRMNDGGQFLANVNSPVRPSVCLLSVCLSVTFVHTTQAVFLAIWYIGHPLTYTQNFTEIVPVEWV